MGGRSGEHEVSLRSGEAVVQAAATLGWQTLPIVFDKAGRATAHGTIGGTLAALEAGRPDAAFIAMHGPYGEDGRIQGALELLGIPYQGSGVLASALGLDKIRTKAALRAVGVPVAPEQVVTRGVAFDADALVAALGLPLVLKTPQSGSSVGVEIVRDREALGARIRALLGEADRVLVEAYVAGREFTAPVLEQHGRAVALPIVEIRPKAAAFFDYGAKYTPGASDELCPAPIPPALESELRALGLAAHAAIGARGYSRTDILVGPSGPVVLEVNTLPGLTAESLLPKSARAAGLTFAELIETLVDNACSSAQTSARA
jgi:D-alanine-D-alanine ligase